MYMNHSYNLHTRGGYISDNLIEKHVGRWCMVFMTLIQVQTVSHVLQTGSSGINYTHKQLKFTMSIQAYYQEAIEKKGIL